MALCDDAPADDRRDCRFGPLQSGSPLAADDIQRHCLRCYLVGRPPPSSVGRPWPAQIVRIARAASYFITFFVVKAFTASPAAQGRFNGPWLKEELCPVGANVRPRRIWRGNP
jgi:hypothetical protein